jgi:hypothetical protein
MKEKQDFLFLIILLGLLTTISLIWLPFMWDKWEERSEPRVYVLSSVECTSGVSCSSCVEQGRNNKCIAGICDASGNCIIPLQGNITKKPGIRELVYS